MPARGKPNHSVEGSKPAPGLYLVATPIGNLDDITLRALQLLRNADLIACEDTRMTGKLLTLLGIGSRPLTPYHEHNADKARPALMDKLAGGASIVLVSDAGTPLVSDPGYRLVKECVEQGVPVTSAPGASAALTALQLSGLPSNRFLFEGFLAVKTAARTRQLESLAGIPATLIFYESPNRLDASLADMLSALGDRPAAIARELTKLHEEVRRGTLSDLSAHYAEAGPPKGEVVVVVGPPPDKEPPGEDEIDRLLERALNQGSLKDAVAAVVRETGLPKRSVYARAVALTNRERK